VTEQPDRQHDADGQRPSNEARLLRLLEAPLSIRSFMLAGLFSLAVLASLHAAEPVMVPIVLAVLLSIMFSPLVRWLRLQLHLPSSIVAAVVLLVVLGGLAIASYFLIAPATAWLETIPDEMREAERKFQSLRDNVDELREAGEQVESIAAGQTDEQPEADAPVRVRVEESAITPFVVGQTWYIAANGFLTLGLLYFLLAADDLFLIKLVRILPTLAKKKLAVQVVRRVHDDIAAYFLTITLINAGLGVAVGTAMWLLGLPNPLLWGIAAAVLNFIPFGGAILGTVAATMVAVANFDSVWQILLVPLVYYALTTAEGSFITPMVLGKRLVLNPVVIFLSIIIWGWMWGIPGIFLAVPIMSAVKIVCDNVEPLHPIGEMLGR